MNDGWKYNCLSAVQNVEEGISPMYNWCFNQWIEAESPLHFFIAWPYSYIYRFTHNREVSLTKKDENIINGYFRAKNISRTLPKRNLILIIGESFESWALDIVDQNKRHITPNLLNLINNRHALYCSKIKSQVLRGLSGDGQMIINTGLLPISSGAACMSYKDNVFPNISSIYKSSFVINPAGNVWNQQEMTEKYGYKYLIQKNLKDWSIGDSVVFSEALNVVSTCHELFSVQIITITTHMPFVNENNSNISLPQDYPKSIRNYLICMHYADSCLGIFINELNQDSLWNHTTLVITGDHTIFKNALLQESQPFFERYNYLSPTKETFCPLIIVSPNIDRQMKIKEQCYQMDIFPTILHCIGVDDYYWKGFGVNLFDSIARNNRTITEEEAYLLSDKMIRSNYFKNIVK